MNAKRVADSQNVMNELVLPNDTNTFGNLMGGRLMYWMDIATAYCATKHCNAPVVTASVDNISFKNPIKLGHYVRMEARLTRAFTSSMEIFVKVWGEETLREFKYESNEAYFTFVSLGADGKPQPVPPLIAETDEDRRLFEGALHRRQARLILAGKLKPMDAVELRALFNQVD